MDQELPEFWYLPDADQHVTDVHPKSWCSPPCPVHGASSHGFRHLTLRYNTKLETFYRICLHGNDHHDPDEREFWMSKLESGGKLSTVVAKLSSYPCPNCPCGCCDFVRE